MKNLANLFIVCSLALVFAFFLGCNNESDDSKLDETARIQLKLVDEPGDYLEVNIEIIDIRYKTSDDDEEDEESWTSFNPESGYPINVDLTELVAGNDLLIVDEVIPIGIMNQVRLVLSDNNTILIEGEEELIHLNTPSAQQSGLKLNLNQELEAGFTYTFILDWVLNESIVKAGNSGNYNLKPVIRVTAEVSSGSVTGQVIETIDDQPSPMENVTVNLYNTSDELVTDTLTNESGIFVVQGLESGSYYIEIMEEGYENYESELIEVIVSQVTEIGTIELILVE